MIVRREGAGIGRRSGRDARSARGAASARYDCETFNPVIPKARETTLVNILLHDPLLLVSAARGYTRRASTPSSIAKAGALDTAPSNARRKRAGCGVAGARRMKGIR